MPETSNNSDPSKKVYVQTYGCQMNEYDTDKILEVLKRENYSYTDSEEAADLIILNTCSIRDKAENKVYSRLGRLRTLKEEKPALKIGVGGCVAQQEGKSILQRAHNVDFVFGTDNLFALPELLQKVNEGKRVSETGRHALQKVRNFIPAYTFQKSQSSGVKAHLAITKGCNNHCSFCIVPLTRGIEVSRKLDDILEEAQRLVDNGTREICLLGQNVNSYNAEGVDFVELLKQLDALQGLERLRFISPHPKDFNEDLADAFVELPSLCEQMHLPLQSGSDRILRSMRRWYTMETFHQKVAMLKNRLPEATLSTDLIVGFPGETEEDFEMTMAAVKKIRFDLIYAFKYSVRPGTRAAEYTSHLSEEVKTERLRILMDTQESIVTEINQKLVGSKQEVLVEGPHSREANKLSGRTRGYHPVTLSHPTAQTGDLVPVKIIQARTYVLEAAAID